MKRFTLFAVLASFFAIPSASAVPINDLIDNAIVIGPTAGSVFGTTIDSTVDLDAPFSGTAVTAPGVWYTFGGTGANINLSTCNMATYDTKISVYSDYTGALSGLTPVAGQDDAPGCVGFTTDLTFLSQASTQYWALVHGFGSAVGNFTLAFSNTDETPSSVPLPGAAWLMLIGLAVVRWRVVAVKG